MLKLNCSTDDLLWRSTASHNETQKPAYKARRRRRKQMGKREQKLKHQQRRSYKGASHYLQDDDNDGFDHQNFSLPSNPSLSDQEDQQENEEVDDEEDEAEEQETQASSVDIPSKFLLYQQSVQKPKGDISYLQKFFLLYIDGRQPFHLQEDFCGTALLSSEWVRTDPRRTAVGLDLDLEALNWSMENNVCKLGLDGCSRFALFHGNVLQPHQAKLINSEPEELIKDINLSEHLEACSTDRVCSSGQVDSAPSADIRQLRINYKQLPGRDIVCAFNYSCCCLHKRKDLVLYFKHVLSILSKAGGIFVMDLYGGTSSECKLRLQRKFANFTYTWEQAEFDIVERKTRISLHFHLQKQQKKLRHAFSYSWRLWSLPEIKDCLEEAGFCSVHFWLCKMPDSEDIKTTMGFGMGRDATYEEVKSFQQSDSWNAYVVGVAK